MGNRTPKIPGRDHPGCSTRGFGHVVNQDFAGYHIAANADVASIEGYFVGEEDEHLMKRRTIGTRGLEVARTGPTRDRRQAYRARHLALRHEVRDGGPSHSKLMTNIELYGTQVAPLVRDMLA